MASKDKVGWAQVWVGLAAAAVVVALGAISWVQVNKANKSNTASSAVLASHQGDLPNFSTDSSSRGGFSVMASKDKVGWAQVWVGLAAAAVAIVAGIFSWVQADQAKQQNIVNEQQALVSLVSAIAQDPQNIAQESGTFKGNPAAVNNAEVGTSFTELTDSEEADYLIRVLNGIGVTAIEYYETGIGLEAGVSDKRALQLLADAVTEAKKDLDPRTLQNAWLAEASIWYQAGNYSNYSQDITQAQEAFSPSLGASLYEYNRNLAYVKLFDASYKAGANRCAIAWKEMNEANNSLKGLNGPSQADSIIMTNIRRDCPRA